MKICLFLPVLAQAHDDTSTLLSLKVHTALEAGVDHLLDAVGSRNVTQMSSLLQDLVEESISEGLGELDGDVKTALALIKAELLGDIRNSLREAHCYSQLSLHSNILCFEQCEIDKAVGYKSCGDNCDGTEHTSCRKDLLELYKSHITACRDLDQFVATAISPCPSYDKTCCYLPHTTWNCGGICGSKIGRLEVDKALGKWLRKQIDLFEETWAEWDTLYKVCGASYRSYIEKDAECDCKQAECEARNCEWDTCHFLNCEVSYQKCWGACEQSICKSYPKEQCLEKDRKIDWSATEKIECYVDVVMANPTREELLDKCGTTDCINVWRDEMYHECNKRCPEVDTLAKKTFWVDTLGKNLTDFPKWQEIKEGEVECSTEGDYHGVDNQCIDVIVEMMEAMGTHKRRDGDEDLTGGGEKIHTKHRLEGGEEGIRCTDHLDLDWQMPPCCTPCQERDSPPCEGGKAEGYSTGYDESKYMWIFYGKHGFLDTDTISDFDRAKCYEAEGEHTYEYAYNLCDCQECLKKDTPPCPTCVERKGCTTGAYDYKPHHKANQTANCYDRDDGDRSGVGYQAAKRALEGEKGVLKDLAAPSETEEQ